MVISSSFSFFLLRGSLNKLSLYATLSTTTRRYLTFPRTGVSYIYKGRCVYTILLPFGHFSFSSFFFLTRASNYDALSRHDEERRNDKSAGTIDTMCSLRCYESIFLALPARDADYASRKFAHS